MELLQEIAETLERGEPERVLELTRRAVEDGLPAKEILDEGLIAGMAVVGEKFKRHEIFLPDVLMAAKAMYAGMDELKPLLLSEGAPPRGRVAIGSVKGDLHDIGKNLVGIMLRGAGFDVIDLGNDVSPERFAEAVEREGARVIGMSALLTTTMTNMKKTVDHLEEKGLRGRARVIVGGAPVSEEFARRIGADAYAYDAASAVDRVKLLIESEG
ncbi:MAG: corrinoid protein [Candidatus Eisenbacteria bacterium]|nr:corrinoid protein [Candidatus Eisenbacteria bacterium]